MTATIDDMIRQSARQLDELITAELLNRISVHAVRRARDEARARHPTMNPDDMTGVSISGVFQEVNGYHCAQTMRRPIWWLYLRPEERT